MNDCIQSIPTTYKGVRFRSRLEARWAALFDLLRWPWTYEPFELKGYIPDFVLPFEDGTDVIVEVKPIWRSEREAWRTVMDKIDASGWIGGSNTPVPRRINIRDIPLEQRGCGVHCTECRACCDDEDRFALYESMKPALIVGATIWPDSYPRGHALVGYFRDDSIWSDGWGPAYIVQCHKCKAVFPYMEFGERSCRRCKCDDKHYMGDPFPIERYWNHIKNDAQWRGGRQVNQPIAAGEPCI
ncbi:MAG: hypothetical protein HXY29_14575 [Rhodocyclaceae bacterium]|nr:hypothetical protein [Rhodocyclaceae bacterium]